MSIRLWTGRPGTGKTYTLVRELLKLLDRGEVVYSNFRIEWHGHVRKEWKIGRRYFRSFGLQYWLPRIYRKHVHVPETNLRSWTELHELTELHHCIIAMDEAHMYLNSRKWERLPFEFMRKLAQHRKDAVHIYGTVQNIRRIDVVARELVDYWYICRKIPFFILATEFDLDEDEQHKKPIYTAFWSFRKKWCDRYDTLQKVGPKNTSSP